MVRPDEFLMQAAVIETPGQPPRLIDREHPRAGPDELTVDVTAAPITPLDVLCCSGTSYFGVPQTPYVPGVQGVGVVRTGGSIAGGTPVWFASTAGMQPGDGSMRAVATVAERDIVPLPPGTDPALAGALGLSAVAAWLGLTWRGELLPGEQVLVLGAGGVVGQAAVQLARTAGARRVIAAARSEAARKRALAARPDALVPLDDADTVDGLADAIRSACDGPLDLVLDPLFGLAAVAATRVLRPDGRLVNLGSSAAATAPMESATLRSSSLRVLGYTNNAVSTQMRKQALTHVVQEATAGRLTVEHEAVALADVAAAWRRHVDGQAGGRIVLIPEPVPRDSQET
jgi:NADPH:quinone reductase-like Zn-dependent oxidoreductase